MNKSNRKVWDILKFERETEDGFKYYRGDHGLFLFIFNGAGEKVGKVILNRKFLTGLFRPKYSSKVRRYLGDFEDKFLFFDKTGREQITILWTPKHK